MNEPDPGHVANVLGAVALQVTTEVAAAIEDATGLSLVHASALIALANFADGRSIDELSVLVRLSHSATVRLVDRLAEGDLVRRMTSERDRRVAAIHLTSRGRRTVRSVRRARAAVLDAFVSELPQRELAGLARPLDRLAAGEVDVADNAAAMSEYLCRLCDAEVCGHPQGCPITRTVSRTS